MQQELYRKGSVPLIKTVKMYYLVSFKLEVISCGK